MNCLLCNAKDAPNTPIEIQAHHVVPIAWGGDENGLTIDICESCHRCLHNQARERIKIAKNGGHEKNYVAEVLDKNPKSEILKYVDIAVKAYFIYQQAKLKGCLCENVTKRTILHFKELDLKRLQFNRKLYGFKTIEEYIMALVNSIKF